MADFWNWFDILRFFCCLVYFALAVIDSSPEQLKLLFLTLLGLFQSLKAFSIFSLFKSTRVLLRIVIEIVKDMIPFILFLVATNLVISLLFTSASPRERFTGWRYPQLLMHIFLLDFGDFSIDEYSHLEQFIFVLAAIAVPLVLLNMLIAIMGDTFDRVKEEESLRELLEMVGLVYKYEIVAQALCCFKRKKQKSWKYIFHSRSLKDEGEFEDAHWEGRIRGIKRDIARLQHETEEHHRAQREKREESGRRINNWLKNIEE